MLRKSKPRRRVAPHSPRLALLAALRSERAWVDRGTTFKQLAARAPLLYDLARCAQASRWRKVTWRGIRFTVRRGLAIDAVLDPGHPEQALVAWCSL